MTLKWLDVVGARPQFIKLGPIARAVQAFNRTAGSEAIHQVVVHTGQHYDRSMSDLFFDELDLPRPDRHLGTGSGPHGRQTGEMLAGMEAVLDDEHPDVVVVYGDTNSTLAGALAAAKMDVPVVHVEAGLRSFDRSMPEEVNRVVADHLSDLLLAPTRCAMENLRREGLEGRAHLVGDVMLDSVLFHRELAASGAGPLERLELEPQEYVLATIHRAANTDVAERLDAILRGLDELARSVPVVLPLHPRTRNAIEAADLRPEHLRLIEPVGYHEMLLLEQGARAIVTDSGGVQKEAFFLRVPCVTVRNTTEWPETVETGWNILIEPDADRISSAVLEARAGRDAAPYGDGSSAVRIVDIVHAAFGGDEPRARPSEPIG